MKVIGTMNCPCRLLELLFSHSSVDKNLARRLVMATTSIRIRTDDYRIYATLGIFLLWASRNQKHLSLIGLPSGQVLFME